MSTSDADDIQSLIDTSPPAHRRALPRYGPFQPRVYFFEQAGRGREVGSSGTTQRSSWHPASGRRYG